MKTLPDDRVPCGRLRTDLEGHVLAANAALAKTLGYPSVAALPPRLDALLPAAGRLHYHLHLLPTLAATGQLEEVYLDVASATGDTTPMLINIQVSPEDRAYDWALMKMSQRARWEAAVLEARQEAERRSEEAAASAAQLARALGEIRQQNWLLGKAAEVLPTCMYCGRVKAGADGWQAAIEFLKRNATFVSHGCCPTCEGLLAHDLGA